MVQSLSPCKPAHIKEQCQEHADYPRDCFISAARHLSSELRAVRYFSDGEAFQGSRRAQMLWGGNGKHLRYDDEGGCSGCCRIPCDCRPIDTRLQNHHRRPCRSARDSIVRASDYSHTCVHGGSSVRGGRIRACKVIFKYSHRLSNS